MDQNTQLLLLITIAELIIEKGIPATLNIIKAWEIEDPTIEDIMLLKNKIKDPESYFQK